jgi:hypothetical protein
MELYTGRTRENREGWPLLTVETKVNGDIGLSMVGSLGLSCRYKRFLFSLGCSSRLSTKYFFLTIRYFNSFVPIAQQPGQAVVLGILSLSLYLWAELQSSVLNTPVQFFYTCKF